MNTCPKCEGKGKVHNTPVDHIEDNKCCSICDLCNTISAVICNICKGKGFYHLDDKNPHRGVKGNRCYFCYECQECKGKGFKKSF